MEEQYGAYTDFASVYDLFMDNVPYRSWCAFICGILREQGIDDGILLDLGCGTGAMTRIMDREGYDMIGVDVSEDMLRIARAAEEKRIGEDPGANADRGILYLLQDIREFELFGTVRAIYSACDTLNYITEPEELLNVFSLVNNYLDPGGLFIFDCNTPYKYEKLLAENTFAENRREGSFIWENYYDPQSRINEYDLTLYIRTGEDNYRRFEETHFQRCYFRAEVEELLAEAGLELLAVYDDYTRRMPQEKSERMVFVAREYKKSKTQ